MVKGHTGSDQVLGLESFNGQDYTMWRDKLLTHVQTLDQEYEQGLSEKVQPRAHVGMTTFFDGTPEKPQISVEGEGPKKRQGRGVGATNTGRGLGLGC
ncbi:hypothetical protein PHMEG_00021239 [Phytophthora megakarya]|uniref:Uncharacterized protein n=1 Tax=Phytophthora megakarya TaxID=4795 RepID=A0A225VNM3_9STRA|nr:hypothetical protein PHMEG_00021239 [Phytophthora megakarya]